MKNAGISMLQIVITIVIMLILATVAVLYGNSVSQEARIASVYQEIREIEEALQEASMLKELKKEDNTLTIFNETTLNKVNPSDYATILSDNTSGTYDEEGAYFYMDFTNANNLKNTLEIENIKHDYILDWNNMNIYLVEGIELKGSNNSLPEVKYNSDLIENYYQGTFKR